MISQPWPRTEIGSALAYLIIVPTNDYFRNKKYEGAFSKEDTEKYLNKQRYMHLEFDSSDICPPKENHMKKNYP